MTYKKTYIPNLFLSKYIDRFYTFNQSSDIELGLPPILPGTGLELLFYIHTPLSIATTRLSKGHIVCPRCIAYFDKTNNVSFISVRFKSGAFRHFTSVPFSELNDRYISVQDLWGSRGELLLDILENTNAVSDKIQEIEKFLMQSFINHYQSKNQKWDTVIDQLYYNYTIQTIEELAKKTNLSIRQFERNFKNQFGITPKAFQKITRLQDTVKKIILSNDTAYLDTVLDNGYFDQSHFIKDFKSYAHKTPTAYFTKENFNNHYFYTSVHTKT
ncbi:AraC family transcriptional regulator [Aquimarina longa]|uniref:AraC family transcriptional regulator n=1 Tax=Aquimarina longa TaxID=1080221 RepID=UPI0007850633|nr:helix-turn-helix domain-containing protein [Aquimarina longa]